MVFPSSLLCWVLEQLYQFTSYMKVLQEYLKYILMVPSYICKFVVWLVIIFSSCFAINNPRCSELISKHRVAVAFYGLSRSLKTTLPSFEKHVFAVLDKEGIAYDVFWSGLDSGRINNVRSGETDIKLETTDFVLMRPCVFSVVSQSVIVQTELKLYLQARIGVPNNVTDFYNDGLSSIRNLLGAFQSMRTANSMIAAHSELNNITYDAVVVLRPDTAVVRDIDIAAYLPEIIQEDRKWRAGEQNYVQPLWIPDFQHWKGGYNDRGAFGSVEVISRYLTRGISFRDFSDDVKPFFFGDKLNGEVYLKHYMHIHNLVFRPSALRVVRVRADGTVAYADTVMSIMNMSSATYAPFVANCLVYERHKIYLNPTSC